jgi:hypothetical protein
MKIIIVFIRYFILLQVYSLVGYVFSALNFLDVKFIIHIMFAFVDLLKLFYGYMNSLTA